MRRSSWLLTLILLVAVTGCDLEIERQEVYARHNADTDSVDLLLVYQGVTAPKADDDDIEKALKSALRVLKGEREFMIVDWPFYWNLDEIEKESRETLQKWRNDELKLEIQDPVERARKVEGAVEARKVAEKFSLEALGMFLDEDGQLCGYQQFKIRDVSEVFRIMNRRFDVGAQNMVQDWREHPDDEQDDTDRPSDRTVELWEEKLRVGSQWVTLDRGRLTVDIPIARPDARVWIREMLHDLVDIDDDDDLKFLELWVELATQVDSISFAGDRFVVETSPQPSGAYELKITNPTVEYLPELFQELQKRGHVPDTAMTMERARNLLW